VRNVHNSKKSKKRKSKKTVSDALTRGVSFRSPSARLFPADLPNRKTKFPESFQNGRANARLRSARSARVLPESGIDRTSRESLQAPFAFLRKHFSKRRFWDF
jgi:hypothetical protein